LTGAMPEDGWVAAFGSISDRRTRLPFQGRAIDRSGMATAIHPNDLAIHERTIVRR
jgi:hypothetical protein